MTKRTKMTLEALTLVAFIITPFLKSLLTGTPVVEVLAVQSFITVTILFTLFIFAQPS